MQKFWDRAISATRYNPVDLRNLKSKRVCEYFSTETPLQVSIDSLSKDFELLAENKKEVQGLAYFKEFRQWWREHRFGYVTEPLNLGNPESLLTLGEFLDNLHLQFIHTRLTIQAEENRWKFWTHRTFASLGHGVVFLFRKSSGAIGSLLLLGPGVLMINSYTQPIITPLAQTASQQGAKDLGQVASSIQTYLTRREKMRVVSSEIKEVTQQLRKTDFERASPAEAKAKWARFEETYFDLFLKFNQTLPSHLRDGRGMLRDMMMFAPIGMANNLSNFDTQYWIHRRELENLQKEAKTRTLTRAEIALKKLHQREMAAAEDRIAGALAAWKMYEFMYPEFSNKPGITKTKADLRNTYNTFAKSMHFEVYVKQFASQMEEVLRSIEAEFLTEHRIKL